MTNKIKVSYAPSVRRLPSYLHLIRQAQRNGDDFISGTVIAQELNLEPIQVRKDLSITVEPLIAAIERYLCWDTSHSAVLVGTGNLGSALLGYQEFRLHGLDILAAFDTDPSKIGRMIHGIVTESMDALRSRVRDLKAELAILTVPSPFAQSTAELLVQSGISAIWNFTNVKLKVPPTIIVQREDLSSGYAMLSVMMKQLPPPAQDP